MAVFNPFNGDAQPVFALDIQNGSQTGNIGATAALVQPQGPKLDFFGAVANTSVAGEQGVNEYVSAVITAIQQTATVAMYQVDGTTLSFAVYPQDAFANAAVFLAAANVTYTGFQLDSATDVGFKLAVS